jgi:hypothetical protein
MTQRPPKEDRISPLGWGGRALGQLAVPVKRSGRLLLREPARRAENADCEKLPGAIRNGSDIVLT